MTEAIALASRGTGHVSPNPLVGCVIVSDGKVIGRGWHEHYGGAHAEANAIRDARRNAQGASVDPVAGATAYVSLEPCAHHGKTPPCVDALIAAKLHSVVIATRDPNPKAAGGIEKLRAAGITVITDVEAGPGQLQNRAFFHNVKTGKPWVIAKTATSLDGKIATRDGHSQWITGASARRCGHDLRQMADCIVIGANTLRADNPSLTVRDRWDETLANLDPAHPTRVIVTASGRLPMDAKALNGSLPGKTIVATNDALSADEESALKACGNEVWRLPCSSDGQISVHALLDRLASSSQCVLLEGGATLLGAFADAGAINEVWSFVAPMIIGGRDAPAAVGGFGGAQLEQCLHLRDVHTEALGQDLLIRGIVDTALTTASHPHQRSVPCLQA